MSRFRALPKDEQYQCRECDKVDAGNYFISETLCKKCAAKRRLPMKPITVTLANKIVITGIVEKRLKNKARMDVPNSLLDSVALFVWPASFLSFWLLGSVLFDGLSDFPLFLWGFVSPLGVGAMVYYFLSGPKRKRIEVRFLELSEERQQSILERDRFYSSSEWKSLRSAAIRKFGNRCGICGVEIVRSVDVTVDHVRPRSKFPELALDSSNLQVLCRSCNSQKGDRDS